MATKIDVEQGAIESAPDGVLKYLLHARHRSDHLAAEILQHPLDVERDKAFVLGDEDALAGQRIFGTAIQRTPAHAPRTNRSSPPRLYWHLARRFGLGGLLAQLFELSTPQRRPPHIWETANSAPSSANLRLKRLRQSGPSARGIFVAGGRP